MLSSSNELSQILDHTKHFCLYSGPSLPEDCDYGSMIAIPNKFGIILTGCIGSLGKIYQLTWTSNGNEMKWSTLRDDVIQRSYSPVLMWITDELRDELTTCL